MKGLHTNMGDPNMSCRPQDDEGVGYAHSSNDGWDNITQLERRGITVDTVQLNRGIAELTKEIGQQKAQTGPMEKGKRRKDMSPAERVQLL